MTSLPAVTLDVDGLNCLAKNFPPPPLNALSFAAHDLLLISIPTQLSADLASAARNYVQSFLSSSCERTSFTMADTTQAPEVGM